MVIIDFPNIFSEEKDILEDIPDIEYNNLAKKIIRILKTLLEKRCFTNEGTYQEKEKRYHNHKKQDPEHEFPARSPAGGLGLCSAAGGWFGLPSLTWVLFSFGVFYIQRHEFLPDAFCGGANLRHRGHYVKVCADSVAGVNQRRTTSSLCRMNPRFPLL